MKTSAGPIKGEHQLLRRLELPSYDSRNDQQQTALYKSQPTSKRRFPADATTGRSHRSAHHQLATASLLETVSDASVDRLLAFNDQMKAQLAGIIGTLEGKIHRAKQRKMVEIAQDPNYTLVKGKYLIFLTHVVGQDDRLKLLALQRNQLKREVEEGHALLEDRYNINQ